MKLIEYSDRAALMADVAAKLADDLREALGARDTVTLAVPGGTTPGPVFDALSEVDLDWARVHVLLTDERWVPESDAQSNAALLRARLLVNRAADAHFTPYYTAGSDIATAANQLSARLSGLLPVDVLLLGMGADMHTASLFPGACGVAEALSEGAPMLLPIKIDGQSVQRFTLTAPALRGAGVTRVLITGGDKRDALHKAQTLPAAQAPIQTVLSNAIIHWSTT